MKNPSSSRDENIDVKQSMADPTSLGLIGGVASSIFVVLGGLAVATVKDSTTGDYSYKYFTYGYGLFFWLVFMTAISIGLLVYVKILSDYFQQLPKQSTTATVS